jgi:putative Holliday junction resolvase
MRVIGLDVGTKRVGVALSDELGLTAQPLATLSRGTDRELMEELRAALGDVRPDLVVVGLPLRLDGSEGGSARAARSLATLVGEEFEVDAELWDERFTSVQADRLLQEAGLNSKRRRGITDRVAAAIMLQSYLDAHGDR